MDVIISYTELNHFIKILLYQTQPSLIVNLKKIPFIINKLHVFQT